MNPKTTTFKKAANKTRIDLRAKLEDKIAVLNPVDHADRYRQLQGQLIRLDKKIAEYETFRDDK